MSFIKLLTRFVLPRQIQVRMTSSWTKEEEEWHSSMAWRHASNGAFHHGKTKRKLTSTYQANQNQHSHTPPPYNEEEDKYYTQMSIKHMLCFSK